MMPLFFSNMCSAVTNSKKDFLHNLRLPADKCLIVGEPEDLVPLEEKLRQELGLRLNVYRSEPFYLEVVPKGIDKAASLERLLERPLHD